MSHEPPPPHDRLDAALRRAPGSAMTQQLFRREVSEAQSSRWLGGIVVGQPLSLSLLGGLALLAAVAVVAFALLGGYTRRTRVAGQLVPRLGIATVAAPTAGTLVQMRVEEGQRVLAGEPLAVVAVPRVTRAGGDTVQALQAALGERGDGLAASYSAQRAQLSAQREGLATQAAAAAAELRQIDAELATRGEQQRLAEAALARYRELRARQYVTESDLQQREAAALEQRGYLQALARQRLALQRQHAQLQQALAELPSRLAALAAAEARDRAALAQEVAELSSRSEAVIQAPVTGTVAAVLGHGGQAVQSGQPLLSLLPAASVLEAHLLVPSRAVGFVAAGDTVLLRLHAFPYQKFGQQRGTVLRVSRSALGAGEVAGSAGDARPGEPVYRIVVALERPTVRAFGRDEPLRPGMLLEADILGERRRLWEWAIEPLYALSGTLAER